VISATRIDRHYFDDSLVRFFPSGDSEALAQAVIEVLEDGEATRQRVEQARAYAHRESWQVRKTDYLALVDRLCSGRGLGPVEPTKRTLADAASGCTPGHV